MSSPEPVAHRDVTDREAQLLGQFAGQRVGFGLAGRDLAAGEFPAAGQFRRSGALRDQKRGADRSGRRQRRSGSAWPVTVYRRAMAVLTDEQVDAALPDLDGWERADGALRRSIKFPVVSRRHRRGAPGGRARREQGPSPGYRYSLADSDFRSGHAFRGWHHRRMTWRWRATSTRSSGVSPSARRRVCRCRNPDQGRHRATM